LECAGFFNVEARLWETADAVDGTVVTARGSDGDGGGHSGEE
jgi:hypothetical protein